MKCAALGRGGARAWSDVSPRHPCPVCGARSWCQVARDGATVLCKRVEGDATRENRDGVTFHVHHADARTPWTPPASAPAPLVDRAPPEVLDRAYRAALGALHLEVRDREGLRRRGLDAEHIDRGEYRSLGVTGRAAVARAIVEAVGEDLARRVPGIVRREADGRSWLSLAGDVGLVVPVRSVEGLVVALKVRRREASEGPRYRYVTSTRAGGASAASVVHRPALAPAKASRVGISEGELKVDVATALAGFPFVSVPGVSTWRLALDAVRAMEALEVVVALDRDEAGARATVPLVDALRAEGFAVTAWRWPLNFKGVDDFLNAQRAGDPR
jgi:hypothetical protein